MQLGFSRFTDFIRYVTYDTGIKLIHKPPSEYRLIVKDCQVEGYTETTYITDLASLNAAKNYRQFLERCKPPFKQFKLNVIFAVASHIALHKLDFQDLLIQDILESLNQSIELEQSEIKSSLFTLIASGCFLCEPENRETSEQKLSFIPQNATQALEMVESAMQDKLKEVFKDFNESEFEQLLLS